MRFLNSIREMGKAKDITPEKALRIVLKALQTKGNAPRAPYGSLKTLEEEEGVSKATIWRLVQKSKQLKSPPSQQQPQTAPFSASRKGKSTRPHAITGQVEARVRAVTVCNRVTIAGWAEEAGVHQSTLRRWLLREGAQPKTRYIKPLLTDKHKLDRVQWALTMVNAAGAHGQQKPHFDDMRSVVHVDEKWFYCIKDRQKVWVLPDEELPAPPRMQHKSHPIKLMFLSAVAMPFNQDGIRFDGKIGMWPICEEKEAVKSSKNRAAGTIVTVPVNVDAEVYTELMVKKVVPAVKERMFWLKGKQVRIQQDGARPHTARGVVRAIEAAANTDGWEFALETQPAQSPDTNINDLSIFASLQAQQRKSWTTDIDELKAAVKSVWDSYPVDTIRLAWNTLFNAYTRILKCNGDNDFTIPHTQARARLQQGALPRYFPVDAGLVARARAWLIAAGHTEAA